MQANTTEIILTGGRFVRRTISHQDLGFQEKVLASFAEGANVFLRGVFKVGDRTFHQLVGKNQLILLTELTSLPFKCRWSWSTFYDPDGALIPFFDRGTASPTVKIDDPWIVPSAFGKLIFAQRFEISSSGIYIPNNCYMYCYLEKELYHFPYPNLFNDGRVCMGREWDNHTRALAGLSFVPMDVFIRSIESFYESEMNSDLTSDNTFKCFTRDLEGKWKYLRGYRSHLSQCSASHMRGFAL